MERWSVERGYSSRQNSVQSSVTADIRVREYGNGNGNVPTNCKYTH